MAPEVPDTGAGASPLAGGGAAQSLLPAKGTDGQEAGPVPARPSTPAAGPSPLVLGAIGLVLVGAVLLGLGLSLGNRASPPD